MSGPEIKTPNASNPYQGFTKDQTGLELGLSDPINVAPSAKALKITAVHLSEVADRVIANGVSALELGAATDLLARVKGGPYEQVVAQIVTRIIGAAYFQGTQVSNKANAEAKKQIDDFEKGMASFHEESKSQKFSLLEKSSISVKMAHIDLDSASVKKLLEQSSPMSQADFQAIMAKIFTEKGISDPRNVNK